MTGGPVISQQFRVLHREFLFRVVDRELLSTHAQGDTSKLLLKFIAILVFLSMIFSTPAVFFPDGPPPAARVFLALTLLNFLITTTMLVVGLFAVLSWNSIFPDQLDVFVLGPLPVRARTVFLAKVVAVATALSLTVPALHLLAGLLWPLRLYEVLPSTGSALGVVRLLAAYWVTMLAASTFIFCLVIGTQGLAAHLLPRRHFLRLSPYLQIATFVAIVGGYLVLPTAVTPATVAAARQPGVFDLPSHWFLGLFAQLSGVEPLAALARHAWSALGLVLVVTAATYSLSYFRTMRKIAEQSDSLAAGRAWVWWPRLGTPRQTAIVHFAIRTLLRSAPHRVILTFYWGIGFAMAILFLKTPVGQRLNAKAADAEVMWGELSVGLMLSSLIMVLTALVGARVAFSLPRDLRANWIFRITPPGGSREYLGARRWALFLVSAAPVCAISALVFIASWPATPAWGHLLVILLLGAGLVELSLYGTQKIPFTCSYLPGKSTFYAAVAFAAAALFPATVTFAVAERQALSWPDRYIVFVGGLAVAWVVARIAITLLAADGAAEPQFEEEPSDLMVSLNVWDHRTTFGDVHTGAAAVISTGDADAPPRRSGG